MKRRYPGDSGGPPGPGGFSGRRPNTDPRYRPFPSGNMGPPRGPRGPPGGPPPSRRGGPGPPRNGGFYGRGGPGYPPRRGSGPNGPPGREPSVFRGGPGGPPRGRGPQGMGRGPPIPGRGNMMGRGNGMMARGPMHSRGPPPPMIGRGPPRPGPSNQFSNVPPPPPRGNMGHPPPGASRPPYPNTHIPPPPIHNSHVGMGSQLGQNVPPQFQQRHLPASHSKLPGGHHTPVGGPNASYLAHASHSARQHPGAAASYASGRSFSNAAVATSVAIPNASQQTAAVHSGGNNVSIEASKPTAQQIDDAWKEYISPKGMKYYHNAILKESTYTKPITLTKRQAAAPSQASKKRNWQEYDDATTGKRYYSDGVTTTWERPDDFDADPIVDDEEQEGSRKKKESKLIAESSFSSKAEAIAAFKGLLLAKGIVPIIKWGEVVKIVSSDARWAACEDALTLGERRQALAEYQTKRVNEIKNLDRQERIRAKDAFSQLLTDTLPTITGFSVFGSRFLDVRSALSKDDRFHAVATEKMRETLFLEFCGELRKRDERKKRNKRRDVHDAFVLFLREHEEAGKLTFASTWDSFFSTLGEEATKDSRFDVSATMSDSDRQLYFADFVIELQAEEDEKRRRIRDARRRAEKAQREAYHEVLQKLAAERKISPSTRWRSIEELVSMDQTFKLVEAQDRDSPRSLFEEFVGEWDDIYHHDRSFLSRLIHSSKKKESDIKSETSYKDFTKLLLELASGSQDLYADTRQIINTGEPVSSARLYYDELISRASDMSRRIAQQRKEDSSEDEGEIIEDGEMDEGGGKEDSDKSEDVDAPPTSDPAAETAPN